MNTYRVYFANGNQAMFSASDITLVFIKLLNNSDYYHSITKVELVIDK